MHAKDSPNNTSEHQNRCEAVAVGQVLALVRKGRVADAASVSPRCVDNWVAQRKIPFVRLSARCVRFHLPSVIAALRKFEVREAGEARKIRQSFAAGGKQ
jgi:hypothetical protein